MPLFDRQQSDGGARGRLGRRLRRPLGVVDARLGRRDLAERLAGLGESGRLARDLDRAVEVAMAAVAGLSPLTSPLAVTYLERIRQALEDLSLESGAYVTARGYVAHLVVEADPGAFGAADVPVLGTLPEPRRGRPPQDLLGRVVKASRRGFERIRAVDDGVWEGFVACATYRVHERDAVRGEGSYADPTVIDGLVRFGWVLRQVDLRYGMEPERRC
jgi:hypothetical protein